jgi:hypothetical protein
MYSVIKHVSIYILIIFYHYVKSCDSSIVIVTGHGLDDWGSRVQFQLFSSSCVIDKDMTSFVV